MDVREISINLDAGGNGQKVAISGVSAQSTAITLRTAPSAAAPAFPEIDSVLVYSSVDCFVRQGANPTAVVDTDQFVPGGLFVRLSNILSGNKIAFITSGAAGNVWIYPGA